MNPLVSIIMPSYNGGKYIRKSIESILNQTYCNWELIIIEDCSVDDSLSIIKSYEDDRIRLLVNDENRGIAYSTNRGIKEARGKYIALLDDDDVATENRIEIQVDFLEKNEKIDILGGRTVIINEYDEVINDCGTPRNNPNFIKAKLLFESIDFGNSSAMIRKDFIDKHHLRYKDNSFGMQDFRFFMESSKKGNISSVDAVLLKNRDHSERETYRNRNHYTKERAKLFAEIQRESLALSGFILDDKDFDIINVTMPEGRIVGDSYEAWLRLYGVFRKILVQARNMECEYYSELKILFNQKLRFIYNKIDNFGDISKVIKISLEKECTI